MDVDVIAYSLSLMKSYQINNWGARAFLHPASSPTISALHVQAGAPTAAPLSPIPTVAVQSRPRAAVQTAVFQFPSALDLDPHQPACNHSLEAHHHLLFPQRVHKHT